MYSYNICTERWIILHASWHTGKVLFGFLLHTFHEIYFHCRSGILARKNFHLLIFVLFNFHYLILPCGLIITLLKIICVFNLHCHTVLMKFINNDNFPLTVSIYLLSMLHRYFYMWRWLLLYYAQLDLHSMPVYMYSVARLTLQTIQELKFVAFWG